MIQRLGTITVYVSDQQEALRFWTEKVGFDVRVRQPMGPGAEWIEVAPAGAETRLVIYPRAMMPNWHEMKPSAIFECGDVQATYDAMAARGVVFADKPQAMPWGTFAKFQDSDGNEFLVKG